ncbi:hypothetical protein BMF94_3413 [Rhodotorula taiwanensis]|uniref:Stress-response A/B barrel domain-containing protein n=1 Tax=Rhodotorula taiwanensis TaxID=741276 RepID=A0A2S5B9M7_9BASI|nr:hypothetical protein BMF94_3413 [Rhodotorula taiwanensis]
MPGSIIHTVFWKWNGQQPADYTEQLRTAAQAMVGQIPGLKRVEVGPALESTKARSQGWETMLYAEIESEEALKVYADHDAHVHFKTLTGYKTDIMAFDIEV